MLASQEVLHLGSIAVYCGILGAADPGHIPAVVDRRHTLAHRHSHQTRISGLAPGSAIRYYTADYSAACVHRHSRRCSFRRLYTWLGRDLSSQHDCLAAHNGRLRGYGGFE